MALVITLSLIVLVTIAVMAFFARATSNRLIEASRSNAVLADQLGKTGADYVTSIFLQEIVANSTASTNYGITTNALPYLTTFTRALNAPSWSPSTPTGSTIDYAANRDSAAAANRFLPKPLPDNLHSSASIA